MKLLCVGDTAFTKDNYLEWNWLPPNGLIPGDEEKILLNWELPIGDELHPIPRLHGPRLLSNPDSPSVIRKWAPGFVALATNHILDAGENGLSNTITALQHEGFITLGAGMNQDEITQPVIWEETDGKLAILNWVFPETDPDLNCVPGPNYWPGIERAKQYIRDLREKVDWVMVFAHWSDELFSYPRPEDRIIARELVDAGIDIFVGHHPHVVRGMEMINSCPVFYSLGNYYFCSNSPRWDGKMAPRNRESLGIQIILKQGLKPKYEMCSFWQVDHRVIIDPKQRAIRRMDYASRPLNLFSGKEYEDWYLTKRKHFDKVWIRWHFGFRRLGIWGSIKRTFQVLYRALRKGY